MNITIGQAVAWTKVTKKGKTIDFQRCDGVVKEIGDNTAIVEMGNRRCWIPIAELQEPEEYTDIQNVIEAMKNRHKEQPQ